MLAPSFSSSGTRGGWGTRDRGTFMPCLAALVVRRAGPEGESVGDAPHCVEVFPGPVSGVLGARWAMGHFFPERDA